MKPTFCFLPQPGCPAAPSHAGGHRAVCTANLRTKILDFRGFDASIILILRGGILMSIEDFPECFSQAILVGRMLVGRLGVRAARGAARATPSDSHLDPSSEPFTLLDPQLKKLITIMGICVSL